MNEVPSPDAPNEKNLPNEVGTIEDLVQHSLNQDYNKANQVFGNLMTVKMDDMLNQEKAKIANQIHNHINPEDEEINDEDLEEVEDEDTNDENGEDEEEVDEPDTDEESDEADDEGSGSDDDEEEIEGAAV